MERAGKDDVRPRSTAIDFNVEALDLVEIIGPPELMARDFMSPYVWREADGRFGIMLRAVPKDPSTAADTGLAWSGWSEDGGRFAMLDAPSIIPGPGAEDIGGIEDPTVIRLNDGYAVYYTGVRADRAHGQMFYARGPSLDRLEKAGVALAASETMGNTKEATVERTQSGEWRLFFEYAFGDASRIGLATGRDVAGPWTFRPSPFMPREDSWDNWHLSTGPLLMDDPEMPVMFYNGATRDARWRIGWIAFSADCLAVVDRGIMPLVVPPPSDDRAATDIAFAASCVSVGGQVWLYYSLEDKKLARALVRRS
ncbi:glycosidase [Aurantiacibacter spongiae]|uniref:Glycosidase n=2 Tax=Aurantiacibacter spongiae TaxID=2488860 RepID=A0A3N5DD25_9SPHN|nr:glycosidase [Aurantiacibacter spongiae]